MSEDIRHPLRRISYLVHEDFSYITSILLLRTCLGLIETTSALQRSFEP